MKKIISISLTVLFLTVTAGAQFQNIIGKADVSESVRSVTQSADSSYLVAGSFYPFGATKSQEFITRLRKDGSLEWSRKITIPGLSNAFWLISSHAEAVKKNNGMPDGYIMLINETETVSEDPDCYLVRLNNNGGIVWARHITYVSGIKVRPSYNGSGSLSGFIILGYTYAGAVILKTDVTGGQMWQKRIASNVTNGQYRFEDIQATADGGCITAGSLLINFETTKPALFKMDNLGNVTWGRHYVLNIDAEGQPVIYGVTITNTGYALTGYDISTSDGSYNMTFATNTTGQITWAFKYFNAAGEHVALPGSSIAADASGNLVIATRHIDNSTEEDAVIFKLNTAGSVLFAKSFDGSNGFNEIKVTSTNTYCAAGRAQPGPNQNIFVTNISSSGNNKPGCQPVSLTLTRLSAYTKTTENASYNVVLAASANTAVTATSASLLTNQSLCNSLAVKQSTNETNTGKLLVANDMTNQQVIIKWQTAKSDNIQYKAVLRNTTGTLISTVVLSANQPAFMHMQKMQPGIYSITLEQNSKPLAREKVVWVK